MKRVQQKTERKISAALRLALVALLLLLQIAVVVALSMVLKQKIYIAYAILEIMAVLCVARIYTRPGSSTYKPGWIVLIMLVPVVGLTYEFNRFVGRHDNAVTRVRSAPGMWLQNFTTFEPDDSMLEVAIQALELVLPEEKRKDAW